MRSYENDFVEKLSCKAAIYEAALRDTLDYLEYELKREPMFKSKIQAQIVMIRECLTEKEDD